MAVGSTMWPSDVTQHDSAPSLAEQMPVRTTPPTANSAWIQRHGVPAPLFRSGREHAMGLPFSPPSAHMRKPSEGALATPQRPTGRNLMRESADRAPSLGVATQDNDICESDRVLSATTLFAQRSHLHVTHVILACRVQQTMGAAHSLVSASQRSWGRYSGGP